jgi:hypothetical protein
MIGGHGAKSCGVRDFLSTGDGESPGSGRSGTECSQFEIPGPCGLGLAATGVGPNGITIHQDHRDRQVLELFERKVQQVSGEMLIATERSNDVL